MKNFRMYGMFFSTIVILSTANFSCSSKPPGSSSSSSPSVPHFSSTINLADVILKAGEDPESSLLENLHYCQTECPAIDQPHAKNFLDYLESEGTKTVDPSPTCDYLLNNYAKDMKYTYALSLNCYNVALFLKPTQAEKSKDLVVKIKSLLEESIKNNPNNPELKTAFSIIK